MGLELTAHLACRETHEVTHAHSVDWVRMLQVHSRVVPCCSRRNECQVHHDLCWSSNCGVSIFQDDLRIVVGKTEEVCRSKAQVDQ